MLDILKQPTHRRMDDLLDQYKAERECMDGLSLLELRRELHEVIKEIETKKASDYHGKVFGYALLLGRIDSILAVREEENKFERENQNV